MTENFNNLTSAETERLAMLSEEAGEIVLAVGKILRHGYDETHPDNEDPTRDNRTDLEKELGDLAGVVGAMVRAGDLKSESIDKSSKGKMRRAAPYLHHQPYDRETYLSVMSGDKGKS